MSGVQQQRQVVLDAAALLTFIIECWIQAGRPQRLLTPAETAEFVGMSIRSVYRAIDDGSFPIEPMRPNSAPRFPWLLIAQYAATGVAE